MKLLQIGIAHGEKIVLGLTAILCVLAIILALTDASIRPKDVTAEQLKAKIDFINSVAASSKPPTLSEVPDVKNQLERRLSASVSAVSLDSWLTQTPDRGPSTKGPLLYVYEARAPHVGAVDAVGAGEITVTIAPGRRGKHPRLGDGFDHTWTNLDGRTSKIKVVGALIEARQSGDEQGAWFPVTGTVGGKSIEKGGFIPFERFGQADSTAADSGAMAGAGLGVRIVSDNLEAWVRHDLRSRLVIRGNGLDPTRTVPAELRQGILISLGPCPGIDANDAVDWKPLVDMVLPPAKKGEGKSTPADPKRFAKPWTEPIPGLAEVAGEPVFLGPPSDTTTLTITSDVRFALLKVGTGAEGKDIAEFLVTRQFKTASSPERRWLLTPRSFKVPVGEEIGGMVQDVNPFKPGFKQNIDLNTGFSLVEVQRAQKRVQYFEVKERARTGEKDKKLKLLELVQKTAASDAVVVRNTHTKRASTFLRLGAIKPPTKTPGKTGPFIYPRYDADVDEQAQFLAGPDTFEQAVLVPEQPKKHAPDEGPLVKLRAENPEAKDIFTTDVDYFEFPDGRIIWYDPINYVTHVHPEDGAAAPQPAMPNGPPADGMQGPQGMPFGANGMPRRPGP